jgi:di/tricarboxylate transporter
MQNCIISLLKATLYKVVEVLSLSDYILSVFFSNTRQSVCLYVLEENRKRVVHQSSEATNVKDKKAKKELKVKQNKKEKRRRSYILSVMLMQKNLVLEMCAC